MEFKCAICSKVFRTNASLYIHKQQHSPKLVLMSHDHNANNENDLDKSDESDYTVIDEYIRPDNNNKRKHDKNNEDYPAPKRSHHVSDTTNRRGERSDWKVLDRYDYNPDHDNNQLIIPKVQGKRPLDKDDHSDHHTKKLKGVIHPRSKSFKRNRSRGYKKRRPYGESDWRVLDTYDDPGDKSDDDYKRRYEDCLEDKKKAISDHNNKITEMRHEYEQKIRELRNKLGDISQDKDLELKRQIEALNKELTTKNNEDIQLIKAKHDAEIEKIEAECEDKIELLNNQIKSLQESDASLDGLTKSIFNCTTMEEIFEIQNLISNHQIDLLVQRHLKTLQRLFFSLSYGVLPVCQPQRDKVSDNQRRLVEKIQKATSSNAKRMIKENRGEIVNLFSIINDSLRLARDSFNRFGTSSA